MKKKLLITLPLTRTFLLFIGFVPIFYFDNTLIKIIALVSIVVIYFPTHYLLNKLLTQKIKEGKIHVFGIDKTYEMYEKLFVIIGLVLLMVMVYFSLNNEKTFHQSYTMFFIILIGLFNSNFIFPNLKWQIMIEEGKMVFPKLFKQSRVLNNQMEVLDTYGYKLKIKDGDWETEIPKVEGEDSRLKELIAQSGSLEIS